MSRARKPVTARDEKVDMDVVSKRTQQLHELEMKHQHGASKSDLLIKDEDVRRLKLRILVLRDENTNLRDRVAQNSDENTRLSSQCEDLGAQLEAKIQVVRSQEKQLRKQEREFSSLKAELQTVNNANQNSTTVLAEKLALDRELAVLKPELEHLRSQLAHQQATLAEKLALERQVNTLEVELANEKKATKRAMQKRESTDRTEDDLRKQLREVEKELVAEKAQRERLEDQLNQEKRTRQLAMEDQDSTRELESDLRRKLQEAQKQLRASQEENERLGEELVTEKRQSQKTQKLQQTGSSDEVDELNTRLAEFEGKLQASQKEAKKIREEAQNSVDEADRRADTFEKKFEKLKMKFRELQDELKQNQAELRKAQKAHPAAVDHIDLKNAGRPAFKKRKAEDTSKTDFSQITIATPGADNKPLKTIKKKMTEPSLMGEKSTFSITPFLNRSKTLGTDDAQDDDEEAVDTSYIPGNKTTTPASVSSETPAAAEADASTSSAEAEPAATEEAELQKPKLQPKARGRPKKILGDAASVKKNSQPVPKTALKKKTSKPAQPLEMVAEEGQENDAHAPEEKTQTVKFNVTLPQDTSTSSANTSTISQPKKKKRKVLGSTKTLFDEDEEAVAPVVSKAAAKPAMNGAKKRAPLGGAVKNAFAGASFSPLKRDRRGVGASFLA